MTLSIEPPDQLAITERVLKRLVDLGRNALLYPLLEDLRPPDVDVDTADLLALEQLVGLGAAPCRRAAVRAQIELEQVRIVDVAAQPRDPLRTSKARRKGDGLELIQRLAG